MEGPSSSESQPRRRRIATREIDAVQRACRSLVAISARSIAAVTDKIDPVQFRALVVLDSRGSLSLGELATACEMHLSTASRLCDRLVTAGLVNRSQDPGNRRQVLLTLTPLAADMVEHVMQERRAALTPMLQALTGEESRILTELLTLFVSGGPRPAESDLWSMGWSTREDAQNHQ